MKRLKVIMFLVPVLNKMGFVFTREYSTKHFILFSIRWYSKKEYATYFLYQWSVSDFDLIKEESLVEKLKLK